MVKRIGIVVLAVVICGALLLCTVAYTVRYDQQALVTTFGKAGEPIKGSTHAGLKFKLPWPIQKVTIYDSTMFTLEDAIAEVQTRDERKIQITAYCVWRIDDVAKFHRSKQTVKAAVEALRHLLAGSKSTVIGSHNMADLVNIDPDKMLISQIEQEILQPVRTLAGNDWGIDVVSVGIKTLALPEAVTAKVIETMKKEREDDAKTLRAQGQATAQAIRERAKGAAAKIIAFANRKADSIESEGARAAAELYPHFMRNERFSMFLRSLKSLETELSGQAVFLLDGSTLPAVDFFRNGPSLPKKTPARGK